MDLKQRIVYGLGAAFCIGLLAVLAVIVAGVMALHRVLP